MAILGYLIPAPPILAQGHSVTTEIRYESDEARTVWLVWGVDGWQMLPDAAMPPDTFKWQEMMQTRMERQGNTFVARLTLPTGTRLDYKFLITRKQSGSAVQLWERDGAKDFRWQVTEPSTRQHTSQVNVVAAKEILQSLTIKSSTLIAFLVLIGLMGVANFQLRQPPSRLAQYPLRVLCTSTILYLFLLVLRFKLFGFQWFSLQESSILIPYTLASGYYDFLYLLVITSLTLLLLQASRGHPRWQRALYGAYYGVAILSLALAIVNLRSLAIIDHPLTYPLLYYSGFLQGKEAYDVIAANLPWQLALSTVIICTALPIFARTLFHLTEFLGQRFSFARPLWPRIGTLAGTFAAILIATLATVLVYMPTANYFIQQNGWEYATLANPITVLLTSTLQSANKPLLYTMQVPEQYVEPYDAPAQSNGQNGQAQSIETPVALQSPTKIRNVILIVLESVAAEYTEPYGGSYPVTPQLSRYRDQSILFSNIYAHAPSSNKSLVSLLGAIYPWISYQDLTQEYPDAEFPTLSSELKQAGYRTAFLSTSNMNYQNGTEFLAHRQFDLFQDQQTIPCEQTAYSDPAFAAISLDGLDDLCLVDALSAWINQDEQTPFFAMLWTFATHYPYFVAGDRVEYEVEDSAQNRYLNALWRSDEMMGQILQGLREQGVAESTLLVIVGDHGEAFGRHDQSGHSFYIYEENVHVPLIMINAGLFHGESNAAIGGHVDVAPTIMHILDLPAPSQWQGKSLFRADRADRTYFFTTLLDSAFGMREGNLKLIFNPITNQNEVYDLASDPTEMVNLASSYPDFVTEGQQRLAAWIQHQERFMKELLATEK